MTLGVLISFFAIMTLFFWKWDEKTNNRNKAFTCFAYLLLWGWWSMGMKGVWPDHRAFPCRIDFSFYHFFLLMFLIGGKSIQLSGVEKHLPVRFIFIIMGVLAGALSLTPLTVVWDHQLMPFFLTIHAAAGGLSTPISAALMLAWAVIHVDPRLRRRLQLLFVHHGFTWMVDACLPHKKLNEWMVATGAKTAGLLSRIPVIKRLHPIQPRNLHPRWLVYLQNQSEQVLESCHRGNSSRINHMACLCHALQVHWRETGALFEDNRIRGRLNLARLSYLELAAHFLSMRGKKRKRKAFIRDAFAIVIREGRLPRLLDGLDANAILKKRKEQRALFEAIKNGESPLHPVETFPSGAELTTRYHYLLLAINLLRATEKDKKLSAHRLHGFIRLKSEMDMFIESLPPAPAQISLSEDLMAAAPAANGGPPIPIDLTDVRRDYELDARVKKVLSGQRENGAFHQAVMADHGCLLYLLCAWADLLTEYDAVFGVESGLIINCLGPVKDYRYGVHAQHAHLLLAGNLMKRARMSEWTETPEPTGKPLHNYLEIHRILHTYQGRSTREQHQES